MRRPSWRWGLILVVTMTLSDVINNAATAVVMAPISLGVASSLGVNPDAFLMAVGDRGILRLPHAHRPPEQRADHGARRATASAITGVWACRSNW